MANDVCMHVSNQNLDEDEYASLHAFVGTAEKIALDAENGAQSYFGENGYKAAMVALLSLLALGKSLDLTCILSPSVRSFDPEEIHEVASRVVAEQDASNGIVSSAWRNLYIVLLMQSRQILLKARASNDTVDQAKAEALFSLLLIPLQKSIGSGDNMWRLKVLKACIVSAYNQ